MTRITSLLSLIVLIYPGFAAAFRTPNLIPCEAMLSHASAEVSRDASVQTALETLKTQVMANGAKPFDVAGLDHVEAAMRPHPDAQAVTLIFRGPQVQKARDLYVAARGELNEGYREYVRGQFGVRRLFERLVAGSLFALSLYGMKVGGHNLIHDGGLLPLVTFGAASFNTLLMSFMVLRKRLTFEAFPSVITEQLQQAVQGKPFAPVFRRAFFETDARVVSELLTSRLSVEVRNEAYRRFSNTMVGSTIDMAHVLSSPDWMVKFVENERTVDLHQVVFFDCTANEPVWIYVVRSTRRRIGAPRRPPGRTAPQTAGAFGWAG